MKDLWKVDYPPEDPEQRWIWIYQVQEHLFGTREMQNELLRAWGFSYTRKDRRKKPLRDKMGGISLRARDRELKNPATVLNEPHVPADWRSTGYQPRRGMETLLVGDGRKSLR